MISLPTRIDDCWNRIGIAGDRSCPELEQHVHCRNCPVFADAAQIFFDRPAPEGYLEEWTEALAPAEQKMDRDYVSALVFRVEGEWLALPTSFLVEVTAQRTPHLVPHRSNEVFRGLVNVRGQLLLCVSLHGVLGIEPAEDSEPSAQSRLVVVEHKGERWAFAADEVFGVERIPRSELGKVPGTLANPSGSFSHAVFSWRQQHVGLLDEQRLLTAFRSLGA